MLIAMINHMFPKHLSFLTHVVKASYTLLLVLSIKLPILVAIPIMISDLLPLVSKRFNFAEQVGAWCRIAFIGIGFYKTQFNVYLIAFYVLCNAIYYFERRQRIKSGKRFDYGWSHHYEHFSIFIYLFFVNYHDLNIPLTVKAVICVPLIVYSFFVILGFSVNLYLKRNSNVLPPWFDKNIETYFRKKINKNLSSLKLYNYFFKPFSPTMILRNVKWKDIESMVDSIAIQEKVDVVIGIHSGGAFIAPYVAKKHNIEQVSYIHSCFWSHMGPIENFKIVMEHYFLNKSKIRKPKIHIPQNLDVAGKTVLLVDDTICFSNTMNTASSLLLQMNAKKVLRYCLFCSPEGKADYAYASSWTPLIWPWGWESD